MIVYVTDVLDQMSLRGVERRSNLSPIKQIASRCLPSAQSRARNDITENFRTHYLINLSFPILKRSLNFSICILLF